jgi:DNA-binding response OmpR family regulator
LALAESAGRVLSREALMEKLKGEALEAFDRSSTCISRASGPPSKTTRRGPRRIVTVRGSGYVFARQQD